jgi:HK97 family phage prohead protease
MKFRNSERREPEGFVPGQTISRALTLAPSSYSSTNRTVDGVFSTGAGVRRYGIIEELVVAADAIDMTRAASGRMAVLWNHDQDDPVGVVTRSAIENGALVGTIRFNDTERGRAIEGMVARGEISTLSIGYRVNSWSMRAIEDDVEIWTATKWEVYEVSFAPVPADFNSAVRTAVTTANEANIQETDDMRRNTAPAPAPASEPVETTRTTPAVAPSQVVQPPVAAAAPTEDGLAVERRRSADILDIGRRAGLTHEVIDTAIASGEGVEAFRARAFEHLTSQPAARPISTVRGGLDETETRRLAMGEALTRAMAHDQPAVWSESARAYHGLNLVSLAAERLGERRVGDSFAAREAVLQRAMHSTADFPIILENALNRTLAARYALAAPTYREISRRGDFTDFRPHTSVQAGDFPMLMPIGEGGEIKYGTFGENKESLAVGSFARAIRISRQVMVNDTLGAMGDVLASYGTIVALLEEVTSYAVINANSGAGPALNEGAANMFATARLNLAGTGTAITVDALAAARAAMRKYKTIDGNTMLYNAPSILLVSPDKETEAEKIVAPLVPAQTANINPFVGRLRPLVSAHLTGNRWWLFSDPNVRSNFRWGYLNGYEAPRTRIDEPFGQQGMAVSVEHDFGFGGIDWRAAYCNPGA